MSDAGHSDQCLYNREAIASHATQLKELRTRLEKMEQNQDKLADVLNKIREKIFDGYDDALRHTSKRVDEIMTAVKELSDKGGVEVSQVQSLIDAAVIKYDNKTMRDQDTKKKWLKNHRIELLAGFVGLCMLAVTILTFVTR